jgi:hypothetical protein
VILSSSKSFLFLHVYKVAGSSIRRGLLPYANKRIVAGQAVNSVLQQLRMPALKNPLYNYHPRLRDVRDVLGGDEFEKLFKFTFVRNPWDWQVSLYHYALQSPRHPQYDLMKSMADFDAYLDWRVNEDLKLQSDFVCDEDGKLLVDYLGHFETLNDDFKHVCEQVGIPYNLPFINQSKRRQYAEYYSDRGRELIEKAFAADIERFGYRFDAA